MIPLKINFPFKGDITKFIRYQTESEKAGQKVVLLCDNDGQKMRMIEIFDEYNVGYEGLDGTMVMFPSQVLHHVEKQVVDTERITLAFNIISNDAF